MERNQVINSHEIWQTLISNWGDLERRLFDHPTEPERVNLRTYLEGINESVGHHFNVLEFVLKHYGSKEGYMKMKKSSSDTRNVTDYYCSENNLIFYRTGICHFKEQEIEDIERLLRHYLKDSEILPT